MQLVNAFLQALCAHALTAGFGKSDITGPIGEIDLMGYARLGQQANGIHLRLNARSFILGDDKSRVAFVNLDAGQVSHFVRLRTVQLLKERLGNYVYSVDNLMIACTHSHSGPAGYLDHFLYQANTFGIVEGEREALAAGIVESIVQAHNEYETNLKSGNEYDVGVHVGSVTGIARNRSPSSYLMNPESERNQYKNNIDEEMTLLSFKEKSTGTLRASFNWHAVHGVSMSELNKYVSGDNKGYAAYLVETNSKLNGTPIVASFGISNAGDVTPNSEVPRCTDTGAECDGGPTSCLSEKGEPRISLCKGYVESQEFDKTKEKGEKQAQVAMNLQTGAPLYSITNSVQFRHAFVDMSNIQMLNNGTIVTTCKPAMGYAFSAGTTDGPGIDQAYQGRGSPKGALKILAFLANTVLDITSLPDASKELKDCQFPKSVLLATGEFTIPYKWQASVVPLQLFVLGRKVVLIAQPSEITTMAGRRLRDTVKQALVEDGVIDQDAKAVIVGLANMYTSYVTTLEEYGNQRYEGGSTIFGPHTLQGYQTKFRELAKTFKADNVEQAVASVSKGARADAEGDYSEFKLNNNLIHKVVLDDTPAKIKKWNWKCFCFEPGFGLVKEDVPAQVKKGETVRAVFHCAHPRNHPTFSPYMAIERKEKNDYWTTVMTDKEWDTKFMWTRTGGALSATSDCELKWSIGETIPVDSGVYRMRVFGTYRKLGDKLESFEGTSGEFTVL